MSVEFENAVISKLTLVMDRLAEFEKTVMDKFNSIEKKIDNVEKRLDNLEKRVDNLEKRVKVLEIAVKENTRLIKENAKLIEENSKTLVIVKNNIAIILNTTTKNNKEQKEKLEQYETKNELEHSRLNYELCKLKANA